MAEATSSLTRLCLLTPRDYTVAALQPRLEAALAAGDVASLIVMAPAGAPESLRAAANAFVPLAVAHGTAAIIHNDARVAAYTKADGIHVDTGVEALAEAIAARPKNGGRMVGAGNFLSRHEAMDAGELDPDYVFCGRLDGDTDATIFPKALELASWWSDVTVIPAIVMGGATTASAAEAAAAGVPFVALSRAIWEHPAGAAAAVREVYDHLARVTEAA